MDKITIKFRDFSIEAHGVSIAALSIIFLALAVFCISASALYVKKKIPRDSETTQQSVVGLPDEML